ncbi:16S rRNA (cytosine1402-N4)-methyltransferase [Chaetoceros tenuissimus]|uniref:16S rRNA (Cytosine1402-N4)-methyltransferase n=1 Tax=Chaetoceros tenuissimus TaxID=426638 RepID=A0AAD3CJC9_9STRA|nr:16S rRNA (cytosine1402-N4)-methyltransferase [Chaetoceros tenuissimus]
MKYMRPYITTAFNSAAIISCGNIGVQAFQPSITTSLHATNLQFTSTQLFSSKSKRKGEITTKKSSNPADIQQEFASSYHAPVMHQECIDALLKRSHNESKKRNKYKKLAQEAKTSKDGIKAQDIDEKRPRIFIDGTLGGGGHSSCLLQNLDADDVLIGCDVDPSALATASTRLKEYIVESDKSNSNSDENPVFIPVQSNFRDLEANVKDLKHPRTGENLFYPNANEEFVGVDGILLDLGISSHQIDNADRGFAFMKDGPLDMRMYGGDFENKAKEFDSDNGDFQFVENKKDGLGGMTAADICNEFTEEEIARILKVYGDEPRARKIAQAIVESRPLATTGDLKEAVSRVTPEFAKKGRRMGRTATLARVFQALRIVVNEEDVVLKDALEDMAPSLLKKGGRLVVLAYHSMEDRAAKRIMRDGSVDGSRGSGGIQRDIFGNEVFETEGKNAKPFKPLGKKQKAREDEIEMNPRARSAVLRVAERL